MADATPNIFTRPDARRIAEGLQRQHDAAAAALAADVPAHWMEQPIGSKIMVLAAVCPFCSTHAALSGEGKHFCRTCHRLLNYCPQN